MTRKFENSEIKKAIEGSGGVILTVAKRLKCDWLTAKTKIEAAGLADLLVSEREATLDLAENKLFENINDNDTTSIIFYLKTQGRKRGYVEKLDVSLPAVNITYKVQSSDDVDGLGQLDERTNNNG